MRRFLILITTVLMLSGLAGGVQAQDDLGKLGRALAPILDRMQDAADTLTRLLEPLPACATIDSDNLRISSLDDALTDGTVYCREIARDGEYQVNPGAIGEQSVIERGVLQAYDVFGLTDAGVAVQRFNHAITVCLKGRGDLVFLGAFTSPRAAQTPQTYRTSNDEGDFTCARLGSPGIVTLVNH